MFSFSHTFHCAAPTGREPVHSLLVNRSHGRAVDGRKNGCWYGGRSAGFDGGFDGVAHEGCCVVLPMGDCRIPCTAMYRQSGKCVSVRIFRRAQAARPAHSESSHNPYTHVCKRSHAALPVALFTPLSFRRSLPPVNAARQLLPCWFASQARPSYLSARWILPTIPARDAPFLLIAHCPPTPCSHMPRPFTPLPSPGFFGTAPYLCCAARPTYMPTLPSLPKLRP